MSRLSRLSRTAAALKVPTAGALSHRAVPPASPRAVTCIATHDGNVRGLVGNAQAHLPLRCAPYPKFLFPRCWVRVRVRAGRECSSRAGSGVLA